MRAHLFGKSLRRDGSQRRRALVGDWGAWGVRVLLCLALLYVAVATAWVGDDAQITFRQVWNFIHGDGMTFNHGERVQAFTHPAWFFLLSGAVAVTGELHATTLALSIALSMAAVLLLLAAERRAGLASQSAPLLTPALLLLFSTAFCDYMTSGLENPLSYFLVGALLWFIAADSSRRWLFLLLALLVLTRPDYAVLFLPLALLLAVTSFKTLLRDAWPGALLLVAWFTFALLYFGSPLPNTFYAKMSTGYPTAEFIERGINYFQVTLLRDPATLLIIAAGIALSVLSRSPVQWALAAGQILYLGFIIRAGGDFMQGRFFALPVFLAVGQIMLFISFPRHSRLRGNDGIAAALLLLAAVLGGITDYPFTPRADDRDLRPLLGITDEQRHFFWAYRYGLLSPDRQWPQPRTQPDAPPTVSNKHKNCGMLGLESLTTHPAIHLVDRCGLSDPFLARLPAIQHPRWRIGHHYRHLPTDYFAYAVGMAPTIADENLRGLLRDVTLAARAPALFTRERIKALWRLNTGHYSSLDLSGYRSRQEPPWVSEPERLRFQLPLEILEVPPKPDGYAWQHWGVLQRMFNTAQITVDPPRPATEMQLSLSHTEAYDVHINGEPIATIDRPDRPEAVLKNHTIPLPRPTQVQTITIQTQGRHPSRAFAIGHLHLR